MAFYDSIQGHGSSGRARALLMHAPRQPLPPAQRAYRISIIVYFVALRVAACFALLPQFFSWYSLGAMAITLSFTVLGITVGYHRMLSHKSFSAHIFVERLLVWLGTWAIQRGPLQWVGIHRYHHRFADQSKDPHDIQRGLWWAHVSWLFHDVPCLREVSVYAPDIQADPFYRWLSRWYLLPQLFIGWLLYILANHYSWPGGGAGILLWVFAVRLSLCYDIVFSVNSVAHRFGYRNFDSPDLSTNCWWVALLTFGEGWHNNHHAFPGSARFGLRPHELDIGWLFIRGLAQLNLVRDIHVAPLIR